jgi:uncharacterized phage-like protein YoqJ
MTELKNSCAFTGHRDVVDVDTTLLKKCIVNLIGRGVDTFYCGMARGFDLIAAETVVELKRDYPNIKLIGCVPCPGQDRYFSNELKEKYSDLLLACDEVKMLSQHYYNGCMYLRDRFMVDNSYYLVAFLREKSGGTYYTVTYAKSSAREIIVM